MLQYFTLHYPRKLCGKVGIKFSVLFLKIVRQHTFVPDLWYVSVNGNDTTSCGNSSKNPCRSFHQVLSNFHATSSSNAFEIVTGISIDIVSDLLVNSNSSLMVQSHDDLGVFARFFQTETLKTTLP